MPEPSLDYPLDLLARVLHGTLRGPGDRRVLRVCTDSRQVQPGDLFFAITGENHDAHRFVSDVLSRGGAAVVDPRRLEGQQLPAGSLVEVPDPLLALGRLAAWHRSRFNVRMVAVTGSVGKTTTKDLVASVLSRQWNTLKNPGNLNAEIGLPLTLLQLGPQHEAAVVEMAMRGPEQIRYLAEIARPDVAVITNIGLSHVELLGSRDAIAAAKSEVLDYLPHGGTAILSADDPYFEFLSGRVPPGVRITGFGTEENAREGTSGAYLGLGPRPGERGAEALGTRFTLRLGRGQSVRWAWVPLLGRHNMHNALAAAAVGHALGISWPRINRGLTEAEISGMRMAVHRLRDGSILLDDAYNASSPEAMHGALQVLGELEGLRKIAVLGSMLELGDASAAAHEEVGRAVAAAPPSCLVTVGEKGALIAESARAAGMDEERIVACADNQEVLHQLASRRRPGDVVLVKGSRGMAMEAVVQGLREGA
ncbi:MAG: MurF [Armatimonadetes bacterium]|nr:MurF [Armatimonadota bacterium]